MSLKKASRWVSQTLAPTRLMLFAILLAVNPIRSGLFQTVNDPGGGGLKAPPLRSRKLLCQSSPYHTCEFYQVFLA